MFVASPALFSATTTPAKTKPASPSPSALTPAKLDTVFFYLQTESEKQKMAVTIGAPLVRVDEIDDRYSLIYDPRTEDYIGLEHGNYTYWEFSWPAVQRVIESSKRYQSHMQELITDGNSTYTQPPPPPSTNTQPATPSAGVDTSSGYVWKQTTDTKKIAGLTCNRWLGDGPMGAEIEAWCTNGPQPKVQAAMEQLRAMNEPVALVPIRTLLPPSVFQTYDALSRGGNTPIEISWGDRSDRSTFTLLKIESRPYQPSLFAIPKLYVKTTLVTMDGMTNSSQ